MPHSHIVVFVFFKDITFREWQAWQHESIDRANCFLVLTKILQQRGSRLPKPTQIQSTHCLHINSTIDVLLINSYTLGDSMWLAVKRAGIMECIRQLFRHEYVFGGLFCCTLKTSSNDNAYRWYVSIASLHIWVHCITMCIIYASTSSLQCRHNVRESVSNHQPHDCFLSRLFRRRSKKSLASLGRRIHRGPVNSPHKWTVTGKMFPFDDVIMLQLDLNSLGDVVVNSKV